MKETVIMSVGDEQSDCPLCMEPLEMDDINFFPCTCGYQICRFCWHRIRTDENGLCPACRKAYPEDPAEFKPLTEDELQRIKKERRQKEAQRKQKAAENRKHLANVRVVQKNLVFVVGLSQRLADPEVLKKHDYFGKFGKIHKVVINQSTSYAGAQGPSASAYVTYHRPEDALKAIQVVNNIHVDGRTLKASLGTTKYCSHFLRGSQCPKPDCMYLHELGEETASFTKEEMQQGKHQEYEQKLYEMYMNVQNISNHQTTTTGTAVTTTTTASTSSPTSSTSKGRKKNSSPVDQGQLGLMPPHSNKDAWPSLQTGESGGSSSNSSSGMSTPKLERLTNGNKAPGLGGQHSGGGSPIGSSSSSSSSSGPGPSETPPLTQSGPSTGSKAPGHQRTHSQHSDPDTSKSKDTNPSSPVSHNHTHHNHIGGNHSNRTSLSQQMSPTLSSQSSVLSGGGGTGGPQLAHRPPPHLQHNNIHNAPTNSSSPSNQLSPSSQYAAQQQLHLQRAGYGQKVPNTMAAIPATRLSPFDNPTESMSLFSSNGFPSSRNPKPLQLLQSDILLTEDNVPAPQDIPDTLPVSSCTDWQAAFGFPNTLQDTHDDDLGFDPWNESAKALAEIMEIERFGGSNSATHPNSQQQHHQQQQLHQQLQQQIQPHAQLQQQQQLQRQQLLSLHQQQQQQQQHHTNQIPPHLQHQHQQMLESKLKGMPPGFSNHIGAPANNQMGLGGSKMLGMMQLNNMQSAQSPPGLYNTDMSDLNNMPMKPDNNLPFHPKNLESINTKDWQDGLRALLPNINISFGQHQQQQQQLQQQQQQQQQQQNTHLPPPGVPRNSLHSALHKNASVGEEPPHWLASLQHLTEDPLAPATSPSPGSLPPSSHSQFAPQPRPSGPMGWSGSSHPPPGFHHKSSAHRLAHTQLPTEAQKVEGLQ